MNGSSSCARAGNTADILSSITDTTPSSVVCNGPGSSVKCRVASQQNSVSASITPQVVTTTEVIANGPRWNQMATSSIMEPLEIHSFMLPDKDVDIDDAE